MSLSKFYYTIIGLIFIASVGHANADVLLISDIDDTIKESHVLSDFDKIGNAFDTDEPFKGMAQLYRSIKMNQPSIEFHYVSNAPDFVMADSHQKFISRNLFPNGQLHLSEKIDSTGHKVRVISNLIETRHPQTVIMIGDNGERDVFVHDEIVHKYANQGIRFIQFIRVAYTQYDGGKVLLANQTGFITAGEIALVLMEQKILSPENTYTVLRYSFTPKYELNMPEWLDCTEMHFDIKRFLQFSPIVQKLDLKVKNRCHLK